MKVKFIELDIEEFRGDASKGECTSDVCALRRAVAFVSSQKKEETFGSTNFNTLADQYKQEVADGAVEQDGVAQCETGSSSIDLVFNLETAQQHGLHKGSTLTFMSTDTGEGGDINQHVLRDKAQSFLQLQHKDFNHGFEPGLYQVSIRKINS